MKEFPTKDPSEFTKEEIVQILSLEKNKEKTTLFYKPKKESMPEICVPYYNKEVHIMKDTSRENVRMMQRRLQNCQHFFHSNSPGQKSRNFLRCWQNIA
ncbi:hypothetical protein GPALN_012376 [Globodera pallida]|nr:hypothetical protein GPALN_012376 [Globodera pallida]